MREIRDLVEQQVLTLLATRLTAIRGDSTHHEQWLRQLLPQLTREFEGRHTSHSAIRACADDVLRRYDDVPVRSFVVALAHREARELLRERVACAAGLSEPRLLRHGLELVAHPVTGLDERVARRPPVDLLAELADEDVDRAIAIAMAPTPDPLHELVAGDDLAGVHAERVQELELGRREPDRDAVDVRLDVARVDQQLLEVEGVAARGRRSAGAAPAATRTRATSSAMASGFTR